MADMTDSAYCQTVKEVAAPLLFREMVSAEAVVRGNEKTLGMTDIHPSERPLIQQIFGSDPEHMAQAAARIVEEHAPEGIDINMGCPVYKITHHFNGAALMRDPARAQAIVRAIKAAVAVPVSVKIRAGWSDPTECVAIAAALEEAGADALTVHGRTKEQGYSGYANWEAVAAVKARVRIPVLVNGDIFCAADARRALAVSGADGVLVARGGLGNPWIFAQIHELLTTGHIATRPTMGQHIALMLHHAVRHQEQYGERAIVSFRKHVSWYTKGLAGAKPLREALVRVQTLEELRTLVAPLLASTEPMPLESRLTSLQPTRYTNEGAPASIVLP
jgi:nifR3 family TIM-barrel protein